ncbi:MAG: LLM class flavin-dependent oxidoreductase [Acidimicrobiia bacterium]|nr:LLM class flavin-dependent oxidoreductase [Acidimicrobiia bacterium]
MELDVLFDPFGGRWDDLGEAAALVAGEGFGGVWLYDHLAGSVHRAPHVLECWTALTAIAATVPRITVGSLVLNAANRDPATLAIAAATLQEVSDGRLLLGIGAGGGVGTPYAAEQRALGRPVPGDIARRATVADAVATFKQVWSGTVNGIGGFLVPRPEPLIIIGGFGPKMAALAGRVGDGINCPGGPRLGQLVDIARAGHASAGRDPDDFVVTTSASPGAIDTQRLAEVGVDRVILMAQPPYVESVRRLATTID